MKPRKDPMDPPDFIIPAASFSLVVYTEEQTLGFQFQGKDGGNIFVAVPGKSIRWLIDDMEELVREMPEVEKWGIPKKTYQTVPDITTH